MESIDSLAKAINQFEGGVVLVSHDMRLISQVAREIWLCDHLTVKKFAGEISDFKMRLRSQMQRNNLIEGGNPSVDNTKQASSSMFVAITPTGKFSTTTAVPAIAPAIAPMIAPKPAVVVPKEETVTAKVSEMNLADASKSNEDPSEPLDDKAIAKMKKKAEKDAAALLKQKEEEERQQRREEKLRDIEEAKRLKEEMQRQKEAFDAEKAAREVLCHLSFSRLLFFPS
jgi:hypothetical protein